ncbi:zinc finger CCCH domain-containing protein 5 isoform X2 [Canna indica]|uniref:Zinc finger CCCH domain-containing protein 5 isoform X2 n=1 Tax=Canna indica TaxID=4628 RepID=A0AAQ3K2T0_9LILI|nr:zinc finger CCCH domain-containing protein 5 isoform X2 [Canna indica]
MDASSVSAQEALERVAQEVPNFGTEQDKAHCPFHLKTGVCRFGSRCSRVHFHPDKSCTLLIKNMYNGPGLAWDQDEGLEYTDEEVERCYEEFYEDVHTEFLKFGELVNFKVCNNGSYHLRGNLYVHYKSLDSAVLAYNNTNGRYFAGKQITCEFVSLTRWKAAICGEYMKSRLKTCSHGSACNFIHCFRNPGGDYEWADWDNPPPKYWIRKMVALFGLSNDYENDKDYRESERQRCSSRNRTATNKGSHSHRSDSSDSPAKDSDMMRDQPSRRSNRREQSSRSSRGKAYLTFMEKYERPEKYDESAKRHRMHSYDSSEDIYKENDRVKYPKYEDHYYDREKFKHRDKEDFLRQKRGRDHSDEHMKSKYTSRFHEKQECIQTSDYTDDDRELSDGHSDSLSIDKSNLSIDDNRYYGRSHDQSSNRLTIDEERYTGRSVEEVGSNADSTCVRQSACPTESRKHNQYISPRQLTNVSRDQGSNGRNSAFRSEGSDPEGAHDHLPHRSSRKRKHDDSRKRKHHREKGSRDEFSNRRKDEKYCSRYSSSSGRKFNEPINYDS